MKRLLLPLLISFFTSVAALAQSASVSPSASTYSTAGGQISFTVTINYPANVSAISFSAKPPSGSWLHVSTGGTNVPSVKPNTGDSTNPSDANSVFGWSYIDVVPNTSSFTFVLSYPASLSGNQVVNFAADYRLNGERTAVTVTPVTLTQSTVQVAPTITTHPANATVAATTNATFTVGVTGSPSPTVKWQRSTDGGTTWSDQAADSTYSGVTTPTLTVAGTTLAMSGQRFRALAANGVSPDATSNSALLTVTQAPQITTQPATQVVLAGGSATFTVAATGSGTLTYQWYFTATGTTTSQAISGATSASYTVNNVQSANVGDYVAVVSNGTSPDATSNAAQLTIAARIVRIVSQTAAPSATVVVPVQLLAAGNENALGFTVNFDATQLTFVSAALGANAADSNLLPNSSQAGKVGIALAKPSGATWAAGTQEIVKLTFTVGSSLANATMSPLTFGDTPIAREVVSATSAVLPASYQGGSVVVAAGREADMNGNGTVTIADWVRVGRIVAGLDPRPTGVDFLKADCAPRLNADSSPRLGGGTLTIADWVQAGRYAAGLDPVTDVGGPPDSTPNP